MKRIVLITGISGGIGVATAKKFYNEGWGVIGIDKKKPEGLKRVVEYINVDLSDVKDIDLAIRDIKKKYTGVDAVVNNAAYQACGSLLETSVIQWDHVFNVNLKAPFLIVKGLYLLLKRKRGSIVNIASVHAQATSLNIAAYASSKAALVGLTRNMAVEFAQDHVRVNAVLPGAVDTLMLREGLKRENFSGSNIDKLKQCLGNKHILGRVGQPREIAYAIYFLADSLQSSFITGQVLVVDGGAMAKLSTE